MQKGKHLLLLLFCLQIIIALQGQAPQRLEVDLNQLFTLADKNARTLKIADLNERIAAENINDKKKQLLPNIEASLTVSYLGNGFIADRDFSHGTTVPIPHFGNNFALEATQVIYAGGAIKTSIEMARLDHVLAQLHKQANQQDIRFVIAGYYLELLKLDNQKKILEQNIMQTEKLLHQISARHQQGTALRNNKTRYELQLQSLELALLKLENSEIIINTELVKTLQLPKGTRLAPNGASLNISLQVVNAAAWQEIGIQNSPLLKQLPLYAQQAEWGETLAKAEKKPQVFAFATDKMDGPITIEVPPLNKNFNYWYAGVGIKYNLSSLFKTDNKIKLAKLETQKVAEANSRIQEELANEIEAAHLRYRETLKVYNTHVKAVELATENYTIIKNRYLNDLVLITEMLDAENEKVDAELQAANAQINILFHYYQLKKITGTL